MKRVVRGDRSLESTLVLAWVSLPTENLVKCGTKLRLRDTRIFILGVDMDGRMVIRVPPLPVTLAHLQLVNRLSNRPGKFITLTSSQSPMHFHSRQMSNKLNEFQSRLVN